MHPCTVIGVHGQYTASGEPVICLAVQFWPEEQDTLPEVFFFDRRVLDEYLCLSQTVEVICTVANHSPVPQRGTGDSIIVLDKAIGH